MVRSTRKPRGDHWGLGAEIYEKTWRIRHRIKKISTNNENLASYDKRRVAGGLKRLRKHERA